MKVTILGAGNMGGAIARGLINGSKVAASDITVANPTDGKLDALKSICSDINVINDNSAAVKNADIIILAMKLG